MLRSSPIRLGFKATGARVLVILANYRYIAPLERIERTKRHDR